MSFTANRVLRRTSKWALIGFTIKGTCTLSIMAWTAFAAWSERDDAVTGETWHGPLLVLATFIVGALCVMRFVKRRQRAPGLSATSARPPAP